MKRLLALLLVLGLASAANAALVISVDGVPNPPDTEIEVPISGHVTLDIHADGGEPYFGGVLFAAGPGVIATTPGIFLWNDSTASDMSEEQMINDGWIDGLAGLGYPGVTSIIELTIKDSTEEPDPPYFDPIPDGIVIDGIDFHCTGLGDVIIGLMDGDTFEILDEQVIHQTPEPMTLSLLGLGGLGLLRRRR